MAVKKKSQSDKAIDGTKYVEIRKSGIHRYGGFATRKIRKGTRVIEYKGEKIDKTESLKRCESNNEYIFTLDDDWDIDGKVDWNPARFINHSCDPNCEAIIEKNRIWLFAIKTIQEGEELTFNYGYDLEDYLEHPCQCGAENCVGYIVSTDLFDAVRKKAAKAKVKKK